MKYILTILVIALAAMCQAEDLPVPPEGFEWVRAEEINAAFLLPDGWHFKNISVRETKAYTISKEKPDKEGFFLTGMTVNAIPGIDKKRHMSASESAKRYIGAALKSRKVIAGPWTNSFREFNGYGIVVTNRDEKLGDFNTHHLAIGNDSTGTLYIVVFEAPVETWNDMIVIGNVIMKQLYFDDEV